jgi:hypothetical protein
LDDLFGEAPVAEPAVPAEEPETSTEESETDPSDDGIDDLFGEIPSDSPVIDESEPVAEDSAIEDLFGAAPANQDGIISELPAPAAAEQASVKVISAEQDKIDPLSTTHIRTWIDNSGNFSTQGRLIAINPDYVRLLKTNSKTCTVPHHRLSEADAAYVDSIRKQQSDADLVAMISQ